MFRLTSYLSFLLLLAGAAMAETQPNQPFIHATITFEHGESHTGYLRWESEEATWDDLFHSGYRENPWLEFIDTEALKKEKRDRFYETHGLIKRLAYALSEDEISGPGWRMFLIRFGDIQSIEIRDGQDDFVITADGARHRIGGYANDNGSDLWLYEKGQEPLEVEWNDLVSIEFSAAPEDHEPFAHRLYGTVETSKGSFTGPIMWDKSECLDIDNLDGENDSGDLTIPMGNIRSIEKVDNRSVLIEEKDGSSYDMRGSNDVNEDNRGIWILTQDQGWVDIPWKRFIKATFSDQTEGGNPRSAFGNKQPLVGSVHLTDGTILDGRLVYDLDEGFAWDIFNGSQGQIDYDIPFTLITAIERLPDEACRLSLVSGKTLELSGNQDTGEDHGGMLVFQEGATEAQYVPWRLVQAVEFTHQP
jgi:hypothetical protein